LHTVGLPRRPLRRAEALEDQKRSFLRLVSHELRTPLNSILGFSEILADELYGPLGAPQYKEYAQIIQGSGHKLLKLVNQVLEIARLESQLQPLELRIEPLEGAIDEVAKALRNDRGVTVRVTDDGAGIPVHEQGRIFQRFVRLDSRSHGAGLGLPISRWIAEAHGGRLVLESSGPAGSCFTVTLPSAV